MDFSNQLRIVINSSLFAGLRPSVPVFERGYFVFWRDLLAKFFLALP